MKIGILQTGHMPDDLMARTGDYGPMFERLLGGRGFEFALWPVVDMAFPESALEADGWLITGSRHGAYEDHPWIAPLERLIHEIVAAERPLVGICFGHQIIAQAMGGRVEKFAGGWSVGLTDYEIAGTTLPLNAWHQDQVTRVPHSAETVGRSPFCAHAALLYGRHAFSVQPHPEFDARVIDGLIEVRGPGVVPAPLLAAAAQRLDAPDASPVMADMLARFLGERRIR